MRVVFMGTPAFAVPSLEAVAAEHEVAAVVTRADTGKGRGRKTSFSAVKEWALKAGVPIEQPSTLRSAEVQQAIAAYEPEAIVVVAFGMILPAAVLQMPPRGCINVHASLLPRHRGAAPVAWAILAGDDETGVTTMLMDEGLDTGPILMQRRLPIVADDTGESLGLRVAEAGAELLLETLDGVQRDTLTPQPQNDADATLAPSLKKRDGLIDWTQSAAELDRRVRALQPWPGTFTFLNGERLGVWRALPRAATGSGTDPGTVVTVTEEGVVVACGKGGAVEILELQRAGGKRQAASEFLRGRQIAVGARFEAPAEPATDG